MGRLHSFTWYSANFYGRVGVYILGLRCIVAALRCAPRATVDDGRSVEGERRVVGGERRASSSSLRTKEIPEAFVREAFKNGEKKEDVWTSCRRPRCADQRCEEGCERR